MITGGIVLIIVLGLCGLLFPLPGGVGAAAGSLMRGNEEWSHHDHPHSCLGEARRQELRGSDRRCDRRRQENVAARRIRGNG